MAKRPGRVVVSQEKIYAGVQRIAKWISVARGLHGSGRILLVGIMGGAYRLLMDVSLRMTVPFDIAWLDIKNYPGTAITPRGPILKKVSLPESLTGRQVIILDDILDSGQTMALARDTVLSRHPYRVQTGVLLRKPGSKQRVRPDFYGFNIPDVFVVGYGMDYDSMYRALPMIVELEECS